MDLSHDIHNSSFFHKGFFITSMEFFIEKFHYYPPDLPEIILVLALICVIGAFLNLHLKDFPISLPVIFFFLGCSFEILSFTSDQAQRYADAIQWMNPQLFFDLVTPVIIFNVAFNMDVYMLQKSFWQILLITIPGFFINFILILWYLVSVEKLDLETTPWLLFSAILLSSDPMLTSAAVRGLGLSTGLLNLINGESLMTSVMSVIIFTCTLNINFGLKSMNQSLAWTILNQIASYYLASFLFGILSSRLIQLWMSTVLGDDVHNIGLRFSILYLIYFVCEMVGMSGIFTLATVGLFLNSTSFKPGIEVLLLKFLDCISFVAFLMVFTFVGLLIPAHTYLYVSFYDIYYSLNIYFTITILRIVVLLFMSPLLSRIGDKFSWRWAFIMVWSEMKGVPNINMALLLAYSNLPLGSEKEKSQALFHAVAVCLITLIINRLILPVAANKLGLHDVTSTKYKSLYYTFQHFQEITKCAASALKSDKDLANADWSIVEKEIIIQNPYTLTQGETADYQKANCPNCNKEIVGSFNIEATELANRRLLSAQIASYQRQHRNEFLQQNAAQMLVGAAGNSEEKGEHMTPETIKNYSESKKLLSFIRKQLLNWVYNTKKEKGVSTKYRFLLIFHKLVFADEFEYAGYLVVLMNMFPIIIFLIPDISDIYVNEVTQSSYLFLAFYLLEALIKIVAMRKKYFSQTWNIIELAITFFAIIDVIFMKIKTMNPIIDLTNTMAFFKIIQCLRLVRIFKLITPKLLQLIDKRMSHHLSFQYAILKGYVQGEADVMTIIDQIASSKQIKQMLSKRITRNMVCTMKELGYLEYDHPEIAVTMKTKEEINAMLNLATEIVNVFKLKGILHKIEAAEIDKFIMAKKRELLDFQPIVKPLTITEALYHIPWLDKDQDNINFIEEGAKFVTFDCGNDIFQEGDQPKGIYVIISGMIKLQRSKPSLIADQILSESKETDLQMNYTDYVISGEIIGELNYLTNEPMKYSATCKTVVETCFIAKSHLDEASEHCCPDIEYKMWLKLGLTITAKIIREHLSYEEWTYKMQLKLCNICVKDIPTSIKTDIYDETVFYVILIHGAVEDCQLQKTYRAPFLIPITCPQIQGIEDITKVMIVQNPSDMKKFQWNARKYTFSHKSLVPAASESRKIKHEESFPGPKIPTKEWLRRPSGRLRHVLTAVIRCLLRLKHTSLHQEEGVTSNWILCGCSW